MVRPRVEPVKRKKARKRPKQKAAALQRIPAKQLRRKNRPSAYWIGKLRKNELPFRYTLIMVAVTAIISAPAASAFTQLSVRLPLTFLYLFFAFFAAFIAVKEKERYGLQVTAVGFKIGLFTLLFNSLIDLAFLGGSPRIIESVYAFVGASAGGWVSEREEEEKIY